MKPRQWAQKSIALGTLACFVALPAGNVGAAVSGLVGAIDESGTVVCEASSFQLEDTLAFAPELTWMPLRAISVDATPPSTVLPVTCAVEVAPDTTMPFFW